jgi:hypothetical protein
VVTGPDGENQLYGYIVARDGAVRPAQTVRARLREMLPDHMVPARITLIDRIPLTTNGKPDRSGLPEPGVADVDSPVTTVPLTEMERLVGDVWCRMLAVDRIGMNQNFFDLGASSVLLTKAHLAIEAELGVSIAVTALFEHTTVRRLAGHLAGQTTVDSKGRSPRRSTANARSRRLAARAADGGG